MTGPLVFYTPTGSGLIFKGFKKCTRRVDNRRPTADRIDRFLTFPGICTIRGGVNRVISTRCRRRRR
uniref:Uncharacterized protein n=1 Tax=Romanomermis culicivorax TaxID=13658 RepID=A0A915IWY6_ROMCU